MHATLIAENFVGMWSQARGLAERAGFRHSQQPIIKRETIWKRLPSRLWVRPLSVIEPIQLSPETRLIMSVGGCGAVVGAALGKRYGLPVVQIQNPRTSLHPYALVVANTHDRLKGENVCVARTAMHGVTEDFLQQARQRWASIIRCDDKPVLGVLLGGSNGRYRFGELEAQIIADKMEAFIKQHQVHCVVTSSRRTSERAVALLKKRLEPYGACFRGGEGEENPYAGILACSDCLAVTTDSVSMISEAVATTQPVGILPLTGHSTRIGEFIDLLMRVGRVQSFDVNMARQPVEKLDDTTRAAEEIHRRIML
ncbi:hypothetical protein GS501_04365 [Saccharibacter sp. 17.LH.SD]|uniref:mitochondrial fission ELM1 family protein n=1 Tax=Saccharibacter sp. 17.LH.SD TaxID=2689393 RepID=UPI00136B5A76|nr:mitochondrial fission ELM1 family protein [Saccharibacter sp. 17.LH.SD]MXV44284.1 hypothetical protein [Saccharibacter sp. 17.LH.SD]